MYFFIKLKEKLQYLIQKINNKFDNWQPILPSHLRQSERPTGYYKSVYAWIVKPKLIPHFTQQHYLEIYPSMPISRHCPNTIDEEVHWQFQLDYGTQSEPAFVAIIPQGRFWNNRAVISPDNKLLADVSIVFRIDPRETPNKHPVFWKEIAPLQFINGTVAVLSAPGGHSYFHWLIDILPRIDLLKQSDIDIKSIDYFIVNGFDLPFQQQTLDLLGITRDKLLNGSIHSHIQAQRLVVPSFPRHKCCNTGKWIFNFIQQELLPKALDCQPIAQTKRIYISRAKANRRRVANEAEVINCLQKYGFQVVYLEELSIVEQIKLFASAESVVGPHGAGFTNLVFCSPGTKIIEIYSPNYVSVSYWNISCQIDLDYYYLFGKGDRPPSFVEPHKIYQDILVDIKLLKKLLSLAKIELMN